MTSIYVLLTFNLFQICLLFTINMRTIRLLVYKSELDKADTVPLTLLYIIRI